MDLTPILKKKYPEGYTGGECGVFAHRLVSFPLVGDLYSSKKKAVREQGILTQNLQNDFRAGDVVITSEGTFLGIGAGHVAVILQTGTTKVIESNFKSRHKVSYGREVPIEKIYGVIRGKLLFDTGMTFPIKLKISVLFNNFPKQWDHKVFDRIKQWFLESSGGKIEPEFYPVYTNCKNWWYAHYGSGDGAFYKVISNEYYEQMVTPLSFPNSHATIFVVNKNEWEGEVWDKPYLQEIGWYSPRTNPARIQVACNQTDLSPYYAGKMLFEDAVEHELLHWLFFLGQPSYFDYVHRFHPQRQLEQAFQYLDIERIYLALTN